MGKCLYEKFFLIICGLIVSLALSKNLCHDCNFLKNTDDAFEINAKVFGCFIKVSLPGTLTLGVRRGSCPLCHHPWVAGGAKGVLRTEFFPSVLSSKGALSGIVDSLV